MDIININALEVQGLDKKELMLSKKTQEGISVRFIYGSNFQNAKILRDFIEVICDILNLENKWKSRFILITDEINNNAIEYGSKEGDINSMSIHIYKSESTYEINVEIEDTGKGIAAKHAQEMEELRKQKIATGFKNHTSIRGRGLFMIITHLVDQLYFKDSENGGLIVGIKKRLSV